MQTQHFLFIALPLCQEQLLESSDSLANLLFVSLQIDLLLMFKSSFYSSQFLLVMHEIPKNMNDARVIAYSWKRNSKIGSISFCKGVNKSFARIYF